MAILNKQHEEELISEDDFYDAAIQLKSGAAYKCVPKEFDACLDSTAYDSE